MAGSCIRPPKLQRRREGGRPPDPAARVLYFRWVLAPTCDSFHSSNNGHSASATASAVVGTRLIHTAFGAATPRSGVARGAVRVAIFHRWSGGKQQMVSPRAIRQRQRYAEDPEFRERKLAINRKHRAANKDEIYARRRLNRYGHY